MEPTRSFSPFGNTSPKVLLFGKNTGNWNMSRFQEEGDQKSDSGLYFRINQIAEKYYIPQILVPTPTDCNTHVCIPSDYTVCIHDGAGSVILKRGARADATILASSFCGAIASADCPTIVLYCPCAGITAMVHAGCKSIMDTRYVLEGFPKRKFRSVIDALMEFLQGYSLKFAKAFITCGISGQAYIFPGLAKYVASSFGKECVIGGVGIDLKKIAVKQLAEYDIQEVTSDCVDTYSDVDAHGEYLWHSYRRGQTPKEKTGRNLVLVYQ